MHQPVRRHQQTAQLVARFQGNKKMRGKKFSASLLRLARKTERNVNDRELEGVSGLACLQNRGVQVLPT
jgi:hypothetical protein